MIKSLVNSRACSPYASPVKLCEGFSGSGRDGRGQSIPEINVQGKS